MISTRSAFLLVAVLLASSQLCAARDASPMLDAVREMKPFGFWPADDSTEPV